MLAIIAGQGRLAHHLLRALGPDARPRLCQLAGHEADAALLPGHPRTDFRIETLGSFLADLVSSGVRDVVFAGRIGRPILDPSAIDAATVPLVPRMMQALEAGDDAALRTVLAFFEEAGLAVRAPQDIAPDLLPDAGVPTVAHPSDRDRMDIARAARIVAALGKLDLGQGAVVSHGQALGLEATAGTDAMLAAIATQRAAGLPPGGVLWKAPKPGQDRRIDLPTIGEDTVRAAAAAGLAGIAVPAGSVLLLDPAAAIALADAKGLFVSIHPAEPAA